jgi:hypothetical protein
MSQRLSLPTFTYPIPTPCAQLMWHNLVEECAFFPAKNTKEYKAAAESFYRHLASYTKNVSFLEAIGMMQTTFHVPGMIEIKEVQAKKVSKRRQAEDEDGTIELAIPEVPAVKASRKRAAKPAAIVAVAEAPAANVKAPRSRKRVERVSR